MAAVMPAFSHAGTPAGAQYAPFGQWGAPQGFRSCVLGNSDSQPGLNNAGASPIGADLGGQDIRGTASGNGPRG